ncbi:hypothetical protein GJ654_15470 [Rhodoblastus acidophilus]|uniref:Uncharacterized protein n=1 Tax=Rhodoblastus acidophilus TaxID=1074 RepID=A0A6N8DQ12_RHOAC|nr:hypothetical protein [Rhodoblastus acidophilus]
MADGQTLRLFNAHYEKYGFQPVAVFDGEGRFNTAARPPPMGDPFAIPRSWSPLEETRISSMGQRGSRRDFFILRDTARKREFFWPREPVGRCRGGFFFAGGAVGGLPRERNTISELILRKSNHTVSARSLRDPRKRNRAEILQAKGGLPRERNTISELILRKSYQTSKTSRAPKRKSAQSPRQNPGRAHPATSARSSSTGVITPSSRKSKSWPRQRR